MISNIERPRALYAVQYADKSRGSASKYTGIRQGVVKDDIFDGGENQPNVGGICGLSQAGCVS